MHADIHPAHGVDTSVASSLDSRFPYYEPNESTVALESQRNVPLEEDNAKVPYTLAAWCMK